MHPIDRMYVFDEAHKPWHAREDHSTAFLLIWFLILVGLTVLFWFFGPEAYSQAHIPGVDASDKLEAAGTVLRLLDTALFKWGARILAGLCIMSSAWALKEQRFGMAIICIVGALIFGTATTWVKNIFEISGADSIFGQLCIPFSFVGFQVRRACHTQEEA